MTKLPRGVEHSEKRRERFAGMSPDISSREMQVLFAVARGLTNLDIAESLGLKEVTVKTHLARIFEKTKTRDRAELVTWAFRCGWLQRARCEPSDDLSPFTAQESEVVKLVILGLTNREIGHRVYLSENTVKTRLRKMFQRTGARNRAHLIAIAWHNNLIPAEKWAEVGI